MTGGFIVVSTEFIGFKHEPSSAYMEVWLHAKEVPSEYIKSSSAEFTEEELKDPIIAWCLVHAHDFQTGNRMALVNFVMKKLGDEFPLKMVLNIVDTLGTLLPASENHGYFYAPEIEFFHYSSPVTIDSIDKGKLLAELKALSAKKEED